MKESKEKKAGDERYSNNVKWFHIYCPHRVLALHSEIQLACV